jgi:hypothetical protein
MMADKRRTYTAPDPPQSRTQESCAGRNSVRRSSGADSSDTPRSAAGCSGPAANRHQSMDEPAGEHG